MNFYQVKVQRLVRIPIGPSAFEILRFFRSSEQIIMDDDNTNQEFQHQPILSLECFAQREKDWVCTIEQGNEFQIEIDRIHNKAIFDTFNEALDYCRPFGIKGRPLPWTPYCNYDMHYRRYNIQQILGIARARVIGWAETLCGILLPPNGSVLNNLQIDQDLLPQIREERLDRLLHQEIKETDDRWQQYDEELTDLGLELSEVTFDYLIEEFLQELQQFQA